MTQNLLTFNATGILMVAFNRITGHITAFSANNTAIEAAADVDLIGETIENLEPGESRIIMFVVAFENGKKPEVRLFQFGEGESVVAHPAVKKVLKDLIHQLEDRLQMLGF